MWPDPGRGRILAQRGRRDDRAGSLGDPWLFERANALLETGICPALPPFAERIDTAVRQVELAAEQKGDISPCSRRRHVNCYLSGKAVSRRSRTAFAHSLS
ncbi:MAG: hypothetical protein ACLRVN_03100 [Butyricicoccus sp.]